MKLIAISMWVLGGIAGLIALLLLGLALLGFLGVLADVGYQENLQMGQDALWMSLCAVGTSILFLFVAWFLHRKAKAKR